MSAAQLKRFVQSFNASMAGADSPRGSARTDFYEFSSSQPALFSSHGKEFKVKDSKPLSSSNINKDLRFECK